MKKLIIGLFLLKISFTIHSEEIAHNTSLISEQKENYCKSVLSMAKLLMQGKQAGIPIDRALELIADKKGEENIFSQINKQLVIDAYNEPTYRSKFNKEDQLNDFIARQYINCVKSNY
ncbi:hypothetical protein [Acinetobacter bereziniae]|uniref:hypothetical protein n=1 Tax=Acinetobacter bereziniae TaxID=106648 RepID=UPI00066570AE|nr:hypothetical protein [Acinetobacter bereziniae]